MELVSDPTDKKLRWVMNDGNPTLVPVGGKGGEKETTLDAAAANASAESAAPTEEMSNGTNGVSENDEEAAAATSTAKKPARGRGGGRGGRRGRARGRGRNIYFTGYEKELIDWAMAGFPPGPEGLMPTPEDQEASAVMIREPRSSSSSGGSSRSSSSSSRSSWGDRKPPNKKAKIIQLERGEAAGFFVACI